MFYKLATSDFNIMKKLYPSNPVNSNPELDRIRRYKKWLENRLPEEARTMTLEQ
jgi:hypothetical protein